jgi:hypothetical protein
MSLELPPVIYNTTYWIWRIIHAGRLKKIRRGMSQNEVDVADYHQFGSIKEIIGK